MELLPPGASVLSSKRNLPTDYMVSVEVTRLDVIPGRAVVLGAQAGELGSPRKAHRSTDTVGPSPSQDLRAARPSHEDHPLKGGKVSEHGEDEDNGFQDREEQPY